MLSGFLLLISYIFLTFFANLPIIKGIAALRATYFAPLGLDCLVFLTPQCSLWKEFAAVPATDWRVLWKLLIRFIKNM